MARLDISSASAFCSRGTWSSSYRSNDRSSASASSCRRFSTSFFTAYFPWSWRMSSWLSARTSTSRAPIWRARRSPSKSPWYSATLLVCLPRNRPSRASTRPSPSRTTAPAPAGPGLPRAAPSVKTRTRRASPGEVTRAVGLGCGSAQEPPRLLLLDSERLRGGVERPVLGEREQELRGRGGHLRGRCRGLGLGGIDEAVAVGTGEQLVPGAQVVRHLRRDVALAALASDPHHGHHGEPAALLADALVPREHRAVHAGGDGVALLLQHLHLALQPGEHVLDLLALALDDRFLLGQHPLQVGGPLLQLFVFAGQPADLFLRSLVGLLLDVQLAREGGVLAGRLQLGEARLPLAHLLLLQLQQLLVLPARPLVVGQPAALRIEGRPGLVALRLDLLEPRGMLLCLLREVADLEIDLLQLLQCPQLVTRHVSSLLTFRPA